jgi:hypothetical protein
MNNTALKKEIDLFLPLLSSKQQKLILEMIKNILNVDKTEKRISIAQYNKEIEVAMNEIKSGESVSHKNVLHASKKWLKRK